jgi:hypothetical protein
MISRPLSGGLPGASPSKAIEFSQLEALHTHLESLGQFQVNSLSLFHDSLSKGFSLHLDSQVPDHFSKASTATCILSLLATGQWDSIADKADSEKLAERMLKSKWTSADLPRNNVFTTAFILEAAHALAPDAKSSKLRAADRILQAELTKGYASLEGYPSSGYLTQLAVRALNKRGSLSLELSESVRKWAWTEIHHQLALMQANGKSADAYQLAYTLMLVGELGSPSLTTPEEALLMQSALQVLFEKQLPDGSWPRSQPLFHYPKVGTAYCYEYEMLVQLLSPTSQLQNHLLAFLPNLSRAAYALEPSAFELSDTARGWTSGHHPQNPGPESWATASVFHYVHALGRLLAEEIRRWIFDHLDAPYSPPRDHSVLSAEFGPTLLDSNLEGHGSLKETLLKSFVAPIAKEAAGVRAGRQLSKTTPMSAIFYGPPGTSKTDLAELISKYLGWPLLTVDPSYFVRHGLDQVQSEASRLFQLLSLAEELVVLLDEFDEMVRDRSSATEVLSRFLTTAMLPKLAVINRKRKIVFIVATNYLNKFDLAISRQGRFDLLLPVMPPSLDEKLRVWPEVQQKVTEYRFDEDETVKAKLSDLTYLEFKTLAQRLANATSGAEARALIDSFYENATLNSTMASSGDGQPQKWKEALAEQQKRIRIPE